MLNSDAIPGGGRWCKLLGLFLDELNRPVADIFDPNGSVYRGCPVVHALESPDGKTLKIIPIKAKQNKAKDEYIDILEGVDVFVVFPEGSHALPVVIGQTTHIDVSKHRVVKGANTSGGTGGKLSVGVGEGDTMHITNTVRVSYNKDGTFGVDTAEQNASVKFNIGKDATFRVAHVEHIEGQAEPHEPYPTTEVLLLGRATHKHLNRMRNKIHSLQMQVTNLQKLVLAIQTAAAANPNTSHLSGVTYDAQQAPIEELPRLNDIASGTFKIPNKPVPIGE